MIEAPTFEIRQRQSLTPEMPSSTKESGREGAGSNRGLKATPDERPRLKAAYHLSCLKTLPVLRLMKWIPVRARHVTDS
jgi:hypothetical protein